MVNNGDGTWSYTPALNDDSNVTFSYQVSDGQLSTAAVANLDITPVNDAPTVSGAVTLAAIAEDSGTRLITQSELLATSSDVDGDTLTVLNLAIQNGQGSLVNNGDGTWSYTPALNDDSNVTFSYQVSDGQLNTSAVANLDIIPVNDAPVAVNDTGVVSEDNSLVVPVLNNDSDIEGDTLTVTSIDTTGTVGSVSLVNGVLSYSAAGFFDSLSTGDLALDSFKYTISDGHGGNASATVVMTIQGLDEQIIGGSTGGILTGTDYADDIFGGAGNDTISAGSGNDIISAGAGNNSINGGAGIDTVVYSNASGGEIINLLAGTASGADGSDTLVSIENVTGSNFADNITGDNNDNTLSGGLGNDTLMGGLGNDSMDGGAGTDVLSYANAANGVTINIATGQATGEGTDTFTGMENYVGSNYNDVFVASSATNFVNGGLGVDTVNYSLVTTSIILNLATSAFLFNIENVTGGSGNDNITGNAGDNVLDAGGGSNTLSGLGGSDTLIGGSGSDTFLPGDDTSNDTIIGGGVGFDFLSYTNVTSGTGINVTFTSVGVGTVTGYGVDSFTGIENINGSGFGDTIVGDSTSNTIFGMGGADVINGGGGSDAIHPGDDLSDDVLDGGGGSIDNLIYSEVTSGGISVVMSGPGAGTVTGHGTDTFTNFTGVIGTNFADSMLGGSGDDNLQGQGGNDFIDGGAGNDNIYADDGNDTIVGGTGVDTLRYDDLGSVNSLVVTFSALGTGTAVGFGTDNFSGIENVFGGSGNDNITGDSGSNVLNGGNGNDTLNGGGGNDTLNGGAGNDTLDGGAGNDILSGSSGNDTYVFTNPTSSETDLITDFVHGSDVINLAAFSTTFSALNITTVSGHAQVSVGNEHIDLSGVSAASMTAADFVFV